MKTKKHVILYLTLLITLIGICGCTSKKTEVQNLLTDTEDALAYLRGLEGKWVGLQGNDKKEYGFEYTLSGRDNVIIERLRTDTETEMLTVYSLDNGILRANHFCQLQNQPKLIAVDSGEGDLNFLCDREVGNTASHNERHMHGYHLMKTDSSLRVLVDMYKDGAIATKHRYELFRVDL
jgi:hypothetical protein